MDLMQDHSQQPQPMELEVSTAGPLRSVQLSTSVHVHVYTCIAVLFWPFSKTSLPVPVAGWVIGGLEQVCPSLQMVAGDWRLYNQLQHYPGGIHYIYEPPYLLMNHNFFSVLLVGYTYDFPL